MYWNLEFAYINCKFNILAFDIFVRNLIAMFSAVQWKHRTLHIDKKLNEYVPIQKVALVWLARRAPAPLNRWVHVQRSKYGRDRTIGALGSRSYATGISPILQLVIGPAVRHPCAGRRRRFALLLFFLHPFCFRHLFFFLSPRTGSLDSPNIDDTTGELRFNDTLSYGQTSAVHPPAVLSLQRRGGKRQRRRHGYSGISLMRFRGAQNNLFAALSSDRSVARTFDLRRMQREQKVVREHGREKQPVSIDSRSIGAEKLLYTGDIGTICNSNFS